LGARERTIGAPHLGDLEMGGEGEAGGVHLFALSREWGKMNVDFSERGGGEKREGAGGNAGKTKVSTPFQAQKNSGDMRIEGFTGGQVGYQQIQMRMLRGV